MNEYWGFESYCLNFRIGWRHRQESSCVNEKLYRGWCEWKYHKLFGKHGVPIWLWNNIERYVSHRLFLVFCSDLSVCVHLSLYVSLSVSTSVCLSSLGSISFGLSVSPPLFLSPATAFCLYVSVSFYLCLCLSVSISFFAVSIQRIENRLVLLEKFRQSIQGCTK